VLCLWALALQIWTVNLMALNTKAKAEEREMNRLCKAAADFYIKMQDKMQESQREVEAEKSHLIAEQAKIKSEQEDNPFN
jgi:hypothetical protein